MWDASRWLIAILVVVEIAGDVQVRCDLFVQRYYVVGCHVCLGWMDLRLHPAGARLHWCSQLMPHNAEAYILG